MELHKSEMRISLIITLLLIPKVGKSQMALPTFQGAQMPHLTIFENLQTLAVSLDALTSITKSNFGSVQSTIEGADASFHVFAVVGYGNMAENLQGTGASGGTTSFSSLRFVYNSSASNILSTGNTIVDMTGGPNSVIDGNKWMAMAFYDGSAGFKVIELLLFMRSSVNIHSNIPLKPALPS